MNPRNWRAPIAVTSAIALLALFGMPSESTVVPESTDVRSENTPVLDAATVSVSNAALAGTEGHEPSANDDVVDPSIYRPGERLVKLDDSTQFDQFVQDHGLEVVHGVGASGFAVVKGPFAAISSMASDDRVASTAPHAITVGAGVTNVRDHNYHNAMVNPYAAPNLYEPGVPDHDMNRRVTVAILDTGVAYETAVRGGIPYTRASSLGRSNIVDPIDYVNMDEWANDDHGHGTHIASTIAGNVIVNGVAPLTSLMPIKVLDENNQGTEWALIEGLVHAAQHQVDIINMSLSFAEGYQPSQALQHALNLAYSRGSYLIGASGNDAIDQVSWPAASPYVMAVGAATRTADGSVHAAPYSNLGGAIEFLAPGGDLGVDIDGDGWPDGIPAQSLHPNDHNDVGFWLMGGTSQAAAVVSGLAVGYVQHEADFEYFRQSLQQYAQGQGQRDLGYGAGLIDMGGMTETGRWEHQYLPRHQHVYASIMPYVSRSSGNTYLPRARVYISDGQAPLRRVEVFGTLHGNGDGVVTCVTDNQGICTLKGATVPRRVNGEEVARAWSFSVDMVDYDGMVVPARAGLSFNDAFESFVESIYGGDPELNDLMLAWQFDGSWVSGFISPAPAVSIVDSNGSGLASIPLGITMTRPMLSQLGHASTLGAHLEQQAVTLDVLNLDGSGLASIPLGLQSFRLITLPANGSLMDGSGLASIPLGFNPRTLTQNNGQFLGLDQSGSELYQSRTITGMFLAGGGWENQGYGGAQILASSSEVAIAPSAILDMDGSGTGALEME